MSEIFDQNNKELANKWEASRGCLMKEVELDLKTDSFDLVLFKISRFVGDFYDHTFNDKEDDSNQPIEQITVSEWETKKTQLIQEMTINLAQNNLETAGLKIVNFLSNNYSLSLKNFLDDASEMSKTKHKKKQSRPEKLDREIVTSNDTISEAHPVLIQQKKFLKQLLDKLAHVSPDDTDNLKSIWDQFNAFIARSLLPLRKITSILGIDGERYRYKKLDIFIIRDLYSKLKLKFKK